MADLASFLSKYPDYEVVIGIEVHVQLSTKSKIFCTCSNANVAIPNTTICHICAGYPGVLPVLNQEVVNRGIMAGLATNCTIRQKNQFARKHYFYPDLPKNYQVTQSVFPICENGTVNIRLEDGSFKTIRVMRIHMEEDAGKNMHNTLSNESYVDLNRTGTPLLEIVTMPDISSAAEAKAYLKTLRAIVMYLNICSGNMEEGAFRADTNISVRKKGEPLGTRCELKNINSFKFIGDAVEYEIERQITLLESGGKVIQETRLWDTKEHKTFTMRSKEEAADYRYLPDPDLPDLIIDDAWIERIRALLPEMPDQKFERFCVINKLSPYESEILINDQEIADFYDEAYKINQSKNLVNWILRDLMGLLKEKKISLKSCKITPILLAELLNLIQAGTINTRAAQEVFEAMAETGEPPLAIVKARGLEQMGDSTELEVIIKAIISANPHNVSEYKAGKEKLWGFFVGQAMQKTKGTGNPQVINDLLKKYLQ